MLSNYNGQEWPEEVRTNFLKYVSEGGAFVVVHAADNSFGNWAEYNKMMASEAGAAAMRNRVRISTSKTANCSATPRQAAAARTGRSWSLT